MYCQKCGKAVPEGANFCPYCGAKLAENTETTGITGKIEKALNEDRTHRLALVSCGSCNRVLVEDLLVDIFGYTRPKAQRLVYYAPVEVACNLTGNQAIYTAEIFTEYGAEVCILNEDYSSSLLSASPIRGSIFNFDGSLIPEVSILLNSLDADNRVSGYNQINRPINVVKTSFEPNQPPHVRRFRPNSRSAFNYRPAMYVEENPKRKK